MENQAGTKRSQDVRIAGILTYKETGSTPLKGKLYAGMTDEIATSRQSGIRNDGLSACMELGSRH